MPDKTDYKPVPVAAAKAIAEGYEKSIVIIWCWDPVHGMIHTTTYGRSAEEKQWAAEGGEIGTAALGADLPKSVMYEDFSEETMTDEKIPDRPTEEMRKIFKEFTDTVLRTEAPADFIAGFNPIDYITLAGCAALLKLYYADKDIIAPIAFGMWLQERYRKNMQ